MSENENKGGRPAKQERNPFTNIFLDLTRGATQQMVASKIGVSRQNVGKWISGQTTPDIDTLCKIADAYNVSTDYLLGRTKIKSAEVDLKASCEYTGLTEKACKNLHELLLCVQGKQIKESFQERYKEALRKHSTAQEQVEILKEKNPEAWEIYAAFLNQSAPLSIENQSEEIQKALYAFINTDFSCGEVELIEQLSTNNAIHEIEAINLFLSSPDFNKFINNLSIFLNTNFDCRSQCWIDIVKEKELGDCLDFDFNTRILENALLLEMQNYIRALKTNNLSYYINGIEYDACKNDILDNKESGDENGSNNPPKE